MTELTGREMADYSAWTVTGVVTGLKAVSQPAPKTKPARLRGGAESAPRTIDVQTFTIRQRDGREIEISLTDRQPNLRNGHVVTAVWVARKGVKHGFCVLLDNHTTGEQSRLDDNMKLIRPKVGLVQTAKFGMLATLPALIAMILWTLVPGSLNADNVATFVAVALSALIILFGIGLIVSKLVLDYLNADHHQKIWMAAKEVSDELRASLQQTPRSQS
jgi:hypothetical protein